MLFKDKTSLQLGVKKISEKVPILSLEVIKEPFRMDEKDIEDYYINLYKDHHTIDEVSTPICKVCGKLWIMCEHFD